MSESGCVSCEQILSCDDSPLSTVSSILGIVTFVNALLISIQVYLNSIKNANRNRAEMTHRLSMHYAKAEQLRSKLDRKVEPLAGKIQQASLSRLHDAMRPVAESAKEVDYLLEKPTATARRRKVWKIGAKFIMREHLIKEQLEKMDRDMQQLDEAAANVFAEIEELEAVEVSEFRRALLQRQIDMEQRLTAANSRLLDEVHALQKSLVTNSAENDTTI